MAISPLLQAASEAHARGRLPESASLCEQVLAQEPDNTQANLLLGVLHAKAGNTESAIRLLEKAQRLDHGSFQAPFWLSILYRRVGRLTDSIRAAQTAVTINPDDPQGLAQLAMCYLDARYLPEAESYFREADRRTPKVVQIVASLSQCLSLQARDEEAAQILHRLLSELSADAATLVRHGDTLLGRDYATGAEAFARQALKVSPESKSARILLAKALIVNNSMREADQMLRSPNAGDAEVLALLGTAKEGLGELAEAENCFRDSLKANPRQGFAHFSLIQLSRANEETRVRMADMQGLLLSGDLPARQNAFLHYGLGKAHEDLGEFGLAMDHYEAANEIEYRLKFRDSSMNRLDFSGRTDRILEVFDSEMLSGAHPEGSKSEKPVFVVGMPRSGTTLIEQVLSSHPGVGAAGELSFWLDNWRQAMNSTGHGINWQGLERCASRYLDKLERKAPGKLRVVDKMPTNYSGLGVLRLAFPLGRVIHARRHPVDTCLSIFATANAAKAEFLHHRENIVFAYGEYLRQMEHWRSVLPADSFLEVDYEELVSDQEAVTRRMIEFCGLDWDDRCLSPENNDRPVVTPSVWQVRQPVYKTSVARWRKFEPWLGPFAGLLTEAERSGVVAQ